MQISDRHEREETLDPADWQDLRKLGHQMLDDMLTYLETVRERPVWQPVPDDVKQYFKSPLPLEPEDDASVYADFKENILPFPMGNIHPRFWGWVMGNGSPLAMLAEMLAAGLNPNMGGGNHVANHVEAQVIDWCKEMMGFPSGASGLLVSGGSMANLVALTVARNTKAEFDVRREGLGAAPRRMVLYGSREVHSSIEKAVELLGLGEDSLHLIPVNQDYEIALAALEQAIAADRAAGLQPFCVIGNAGTVNTGAIDNLEGLANICEREKLWFHVDGAFGACAALSPELQPLVAGMEKADSLAFDLHKWMYLPFEIGCVLVRREEDHRRAFSLTPEYLAHGGERGVASGSIWFSDYGVELTRGFRALKAWMSIKANGIRKFGRLIQQNVDQACYLSQLVDATPELQCMAPTPLNVVCFRFKVNGLDDEALNALNQELLIRLHESGIAVPSYTTLDGRYALRVAVTNHRSRREDFDILIDAIVKLGNELIAESAHVVETG
jgi:aromatic-L-amino-acid decarboxylase